MNKKSPEAALVRCSLGCRSRICIGAIKCWSTKKKMIFNKWIFLRFLSLCSFEIFQEVMSAFTTTVANFAAVVLIISFYLYFNDQLCYFHAELHEISVACRQISGDIF